MTLFSSIIGRHSHVNALMLMGIADENTSFPAVLSCPFCGKSTLYCYDDTAREDIWLACDTCSAHGNIITFAAQIWKLSPAQAIARFAENGLNSRRNDVNLTDIFFKMVERQAAAEKLWNAASRQLWAHEDVTISHKLRELGVSPEIPCNALIGVAQHKQIEELCGAVARAFPANFSKTAAIVLPYYDLPQRLSGFLLLQPGEDLTTHRAFIGTSRTGRFKADAGYYLLQTALLPENKALKNSYFIVDEPLWALRAQTTQLRHGLGLLPICASYTGKEATSFGGNLLFFQHSRRFFSSRTVSPDLLSQAAAGRGYVCVIPERKSPLPEMPAKTVGRLANICSQAQTWQESLEDVFKTNNSLTAQAFVAELNIERDKLQKFMRERTALSHEAIQKVLAQVTPHHCADGLKSGTRNVVERGDRWYMVGGESVTNCSPVITRIMHTDTGDKYYEGHVKKDGTIYPFFERACVLENAGLLTYASQHMATHGELVTFLKAWNLRSLSTALHLHPPQIMTVSTQPGWNERTKEFQFRDYVIKADGTVSPVPCPRLCAANPLNLPVPELAPIGLLRNLLVPTPENAAIWAVTGAILANMTAPMVEATPHSFAIEASLFDVFAHFGEQLGCNVTMIGTPYRKNSTGLIRAMEVVRWPEFMSEINEIDQCLNLSIVRCAHSQVFLRTLRASVPSALSFNWYSIVSQNVPDKATDISALRFIVPSYIQHMLQTRFAVHAGVPLVLLVLRDLHKWLNQTYGDTFNLAAVERLIAPPETAHIALMEELNRAISSGDIAVLPRPRTSKQSRDYVIRNRQHWWLNKKAVNDYLKQKSGIVPNWNALLDCFVKQGVFRGESTVNRQTGLLLRRDWCDTFTESGSIATAEQGIKNVG